jgi:predicted oxidoreductase
LPVSIDVLEQQRSSILTQILELGDLRSGSITAINGRCGKPNCHCHQPNQPGHGPNFRLTRKINGKSVSESFASAAELRKAQREVEAFHRFRQLSQELLEVNEKICRVRPVVDTLSPEEKKRRKPSSRRSRAK